MAKSNARTQAQAVAAFNVAAWRTDLTEAATAFASGAKQLLILALAGRGNVEDDTAREAFTDAFAAALVATHGVTDDEARASKSLKNRVSDAMAVFKCEVLPASLPENLQRAADVVRKANPKNAARAPRPGKNKPEAVEGTGELSALAMLENALTQLKNQVGEENDVALSIIGDLVDLAQSLAEALSTDGAE